jgi:hypothetical protein
MALRFGWLIAALALGYSLPPMRLQQQPQLDGLRIRLEGSLEVLESLTSQWVAAREEMNAHALPRTSTLKALRALEVESVEAVAHCQRVNDAGFKVRALEKAQEDWVKEVRKRLTRLGMPEGSTKPGQLVEQMLSHGEIELLKVRVRAPPRSIPVLALSTLWGVAITIVVAFHGRIADVVLSMLVPYTLFRWVQWALRKPARAVLSSRALFARGHTPIDLADIVAVRWPGATLNPTELEFRLKEGANARWTLAPNADALLDRLQALGIQLSPPRS